MNGIYKYTGIDWLLQEDLSKQNYQTLHYQYGDITNGFFNRFKLDWGHNEFG